MKKIELLSPAGNFESAKAAIQNGADAIYFGANRFNARTNSTNFNDEELIKVIEYAKLRNVKTHLTLNIIIKNEELNDAISLINLAYTAGLDAIIVQDLGLASIIHTNFPNLELHASTQMTTYDLDGVKELEKLGFNQIVLARELNINEISEICKNTNLNIEVFAHGALCISYSGQCLMSSIIGGRSGNRGKCAGPCRMLYSLIEENTNTTIEKGYLLSSKDVCTLDILPDLISTGVKSLKIEGRMKSPEYVGIVTKIYRKYIDLAQSNSKYTVDKEDKEMLSQIFNRGGFSAGYINGKLGKEIMYIKKPGHIGNYLGKVSSYSSNKGYVTFKTKNTLELGDSICIKDYSCKISELMKNKQNIKQASLNDEITVGRLKGNIKINDDIYKTVSLKLINEISQISSKENPKRLINAKITIEINKPVCIELTDVLTNISIIHYGILAVKSDKFPISKQRIMEQLQKTGSTPFEFTDIIINIENSSYISIKDINELRRTALAKLEEKIISTFKRASIINDTYIINTQVQEKKEVPSVSLLLNILNKNFNYANLKNVNRIYLPIEHFFNNNLTNVINNITQNFKTYIYFPAIIKGNYKTLIKTNIDNLIYNSNIKGFVLSNISQYTIVMPYTNLDIILNYTFNITNNKTIETLQNYPYSTLILSPELNKDCINNINYKNIKKEFCVYGRTLLMTSEYCPIGTFAKCSQPCKSNKYVLNDTLGFNFPVYTNILNCNSMIYNSKITSICHNDLLVDSIKIDILEETIDEINNIVLTHKNNKRYEGNNYTNSNINKII